MMLILLCLSCLASSAFFGWSLWRVYVDPYGKEISDEKQARCERAVFPWLPVFFLTIAILLNINKWIYFNMRVVAFARVNDGDAGLDHEIKHEEYVKLLAKKFKLNMLTGLFTGAYIAFNLGYFIYGCTQQFE